MITNRRAKDIATLWHGGQWSALYLISCNDNIRKLSLADLENALDETTHDMSRYNTKQSRREATELLNLKIWLTDQIAKRKI